MPPQKFKQGRGPLVNVAKPMMTSAKQYVNPPYGVDITKEKHKYSS